MIIFSLVLAMWLFTTPCIAQVLEVPSFSKGVTLYRAGQFEEAASMMAEIVEQDPNNNYAKYYWAISLVKLDRPEEAKRLYEDILLTETNPRLVGFARKGLSLLQMQPEIVIPETEPTQSLAMSSSAYNQPEHIEQRFEEIESITSPINKNEPYDVVPPSETSFNVPSRDTISQVASQNGVDAAELNRLVQLLAKNPEAMQTLSKLAGMPKKNTSANGFNKIDLKAFAQLAKMMTLNSTLGIMGSSSEEKSSGGGMFGGGGMDNSMMMLMSMMASSQNGDEQGGMNPYAMMNPMMQMYQGGQPGEKPSPDALQMMLQQSMFSGMNGLGGF